MVSAPALASQSQGKKERGLIFSVLENRETRLPTSSKKRILFIFSLSLSLSLSSFLSFSPFVLLLLSFVLDFFTLGILFFSLVEFPSRASIVAGGN